MTSSLLSLVTVLILVTSIPASGANKEPRLDGKRLVSQKPAFTLALPSSLRLMHSSTSRFPEQSSLTRSYVCMSERNKQVEELLIFQVAERTDPQAEPITVPPLRPSADERMYSKGRIKKERRDVDFMVQLMAWNPLAPSLQPIRKAGFTIPSHLALQGQILFVYDIDHAVLVWYSRDVHSFGLNVSEREASWKKGSMGRTENNVLDQFQETMTEMMNSIRIPSF